jgi:hypothetical protein
VIFWPCELRRQIYNFPWLPILIAFGMSNQV